MNLTPTPIRDLVPYAGNSKTHPPEQIALIAQSIEDVGFVGAIVIRNGIIAKGHGTLAAVKSLQAQGKRIYPAPGKAAGAKALPKGTVPVLDATGWTEAQFRAFVIADNRLAEKGGWDSAMLAQEIQALSDAGINLDGLGFSDSEIDNLLDEYTGGGGPMDNNAAATLSETAAPEQAGKESGEGQGGPAKAPPIYSPLLISLSHAEMARWREIKKAAGLPDNSEAFKRLTGITQEQ